MLQTGTAKPKLLSMDAIVYPPCERCGLPWSKHGDCGGYKPSRPIENYGTVFFVSPDPIANFLFKIEQFIQKLRLARLRSA